MSPPPSSPPSTTTIGRHPIRRFMVLIFRLCGIWHDARSSALYRAYAVLLHLVGTFLYTVALCAGCVAQTSVVGRINASGMTLTLVAFNVKLVNLYAHMRTVRLVLDDTERFVLNAAAGELDSVRRSQRRFTAVAGAYYVMASTAGMSAYVSAWLTGTLPFDARFAPLLDDASIASGQGGQYVAVYVFQVAGMVMLCLLNLSTELFLSYLVHLLAVRMAVVGGRLRRLGWAEAGHGERVRAACRRKLVECVRAHQNILRSAAMLEDAFTRGMFAQISLSGTVICVNAFLLTFTSPRDDPARYAFYVIFLCSVIMQIFMPCFFGNELQLASERLLRSAYASNWPLLGVRFGRDLAVFSERTQRKTQIMVGKMFPLNLETFTSIISFAYKLYAVLSK